MTPKSLRLLAIDDNSEVLEDYSAIFSPRKRDSLLDRLSLQPAKNTTTAFSGEPPEYQLDRATQGQAGIDKLKDALDAGEPYAVAFVDVRMPPGLDGIKTIQKLWSIDPHLQIILATAYSDYSFEELQKLLDPQDRLLLINKPFEPIAIRQMTRTLTSKWQLERVHRRDKRKQERLLLEVERSNRDLRDFASVISHDLSAPLRHVTMSIDFLREDLPALDERSKKFMDVIVSSSTRMREMIAGIFEYSLIGTQILKLEMVDVAQLVDLALQNLAEPISQSEVTIELGELATIRCQPVLLTQLLQNLIGNAIKYRGKTEPKVSIECRRVGPDWQLSVSDNGIGMNSEHTDRIFQIFQRLNPGDEYPGLGLGLSHCKRIIERHNGRIWVETHRGKGSRFVAALPATTPLGDSFAPQK